ncbi:Heat shock protein Hsp90, partial [Cynara cardunculus var. scolymus]
PRGFLHSPSILHNLPSNNRLTQRNSFWVFSIMAPVLSRSLTHASVASLPYSPLLSSKTNTQNRLSLRSAFLHQNGLKTNSFSCSGLRWKVDKRGSSVVVRCEASAVAEKEAPEASGEKHEYQAEVSRLMNLIVHSLYSHKEIFLRELVSNASDALDKLRFLSVTDPSLLGDAGELEIRIKPDPEKGTITISDTGIGMTKEELIDCLGTIAQSGTSKFLNALKENKDLGNDNSLIGQFGVGFYSAFLVAEKVIVSTRSPKSDKQYIWEAAADSSSYVIREETDPEKQLRRGTEITLYLKDDDKYEFTEPSRVQGLVKNYSQFVSFPIFTWQEKSRTVEVEEEEEPKEGEETPPEGENKKKKTKTEKYWDWELANETKPIWMRNPKEVEKDQYNEFYKKTFNEFLDPIACTHFTTEGEVEFRSVIYIPGMAPMNNEDVVNPKTKNIRLYVKRVFISDDFDGELVRIMRKRLVRKTFDMIQELADSENKEDYRKFWENFGKFVKLGCIEDTGNHKRITPLLRFFSSKSEDELISLDEYIDNMDEKQNAIYYIATDSLKSAKSAPFLEKLVQKDIEVCIPVKLDSDFGVFFLLNCILTHLWTSNPQVLYLVEPIDEVAIQNLQTYKEKKFVDVSKEDLELGDTDEVKERENKQEYILLCDWMKQQLGDKVSKVQVSNRLSSSPCVLVSGKFGWSANMERLMRAQTLGDTSTLEFMRGRRIMEVNPDHPIIKDLSAACKNEPENNEARRAVELLYETALISSGFTPDSPAELGGKIYEMMAVALGGRWGRVEEDEAAAAADSTTESTSDSTSEGTETEVVEPSEVRAETDPWST